MPAAPQRHTTNYADTFITVATDCSTASAIPPPSRPTPSVAELTFSLISAQPYELTSDDVIFTVHAERHGIPAERRAEARAEFFAVGRACLRASDLGKRYGWGVHSDGQGRVALWPMGSPEYAALAAGTDPTGTDPTGAGQPVRVLPAMRSTGRGRSMTS